MADARDVSLLRQVWEEACWLGHSCQEATAALFGWKQSIVAVSQSLGTAVVSD